MTIKSLNDLRDEALKNAEAHGFTEVSIVEDIALMHSELSEALEDYRAGYLPDTVWYEEKKPFLYMNGIGVSVDGVDIMYQVKHDTPFPKSEGSGNFDELHPYKPCGIPSEMADVIIRVLHFAGKHNIDIEKAVNEKMHYNRTRPFKHGNKIL